MDYTIIGAEVSLAARIQAAADPGGILISHPTWALVRDIVRAKERGSIAAKGIRREVRVFVVAGVRDDHDPASVARAYEAVIGLKKRCHSGARAPPASPEAMTTALKKVSKAGVHRFRAQPCRLSRNDILPLNQILDDLVTFGCGGG